MTQHDLARAVRMPQSSIARIEGGTVVPRTATLMALLQATGLQLVVEPIGSLARDPGVAEGICELCAHEIGEQRGEEACGCDAAQIGVCRQQRLTGSTDFDCLRTDGDRGENRHFVIGRFERHGTNSPAAE
ncbi:MAG: helix-turn-helix transcriptional regulator [Chloroflexota bacterium]|nr:helix-turn-helix transcriptional regulator [Chloroflexota bacterium]